MEIGPPPDSLVAETVFSNDETANAAMRGLYSEILAINNYIGSGGMSLFPCLSADELSTASVNATYEPFLTNSLLSTDGRVAGNFWQRGYFHIYQVNAILENLSKSNNLSTPVRNQLTGEAKFFRAFFHFYLVNLFGDIPLITTTDYRINASISRSDTSLVYEQIISDLTDAKNFLSGNYPTTEKVRVNRWAAAALLARVYLYRKDWIKAELEASTVISSGMYQLPSLNTVFLPNNAEAILQIMTNTASALNTVEGFNFIPSSSSVRPSFVLTPGFMSAFEPGDQRKTVWTNSNTVSGVTYPYPYKYKVRLGIAGAPKSEYEIILRLAELYLIRAEARTQQNAIPGAQSDLNAIRNRAGLPNTTANTSPALLLAIEKERQIEFFVEWGHRWFDLKRTGKAEALLGITKAPNWSTNDRLYPVPQSEIETNHLLTQNPGY